MIYDYDVDTCKVKSVKDREGNTITYLYDDKFKNKS